MAYTKICGVTALADLSGIEALGADAVGFNLIPSSRRVVSVEQAAALARATKRVERIGVVADLTLDELENVFRRTGVDKLQLHGSESPEYFAEAMRRLGDVVYQAIRVATAADVTRSASYGGDRILVDAKLDGQLGGTGHAFDWTLVADLARQRRMILAGGLTDENVQRAVLAVRPFGVDVASGVEMEGRPGVKDLSKVARFVLAAQGAEPARE
jgi:phosphoribosylanthranilate isomerase